jgi:hypothetical protein
MYYKSRRGRVVEWKEQRCFRTRHIWVRILTLARFVTEGQFLKHELLFPCL